MYYKQSQPILERILAAERIIFNVHKNPDYDSISSVCALAESCRQLGKPTKIFACQPVEDALLIFPEAKKTEVIDYSTHTFSEKDLFVIVDSSSDDRVTGSKKIAIPKVPLVVIDHHHFNSIEGEVKLVNTKAAAACEIIYQLFVDWRIKITGKIATMLYCGIAGDTVFFKYPTDAANTMAIANKLLEKGADHDFIVRQAYDNMDYNFVKLIGLFLAKMQVDQTKSGINFVWAAVPYDQFFDYGRVKGAREAAADSFFRSIRGVDFGVAMVESEKGTINISFRSKPGIDVSVMAKSFGGGGHTNAAGATVSGEFAKAIGEIIDKIKKTLP